MRLESRRTDSHGSNNAAVCPYVCLSVCLSVPLSLSLYVCPASIPVPVCACAPVYNLNLTKIEAAPALLMYHYDTPMPAVLSLSPAESPASITVRAPARSNARTHGRRPTAALGRRTSAGRPRRSGTDRDAWRRRGRDRLCDAWRRRGSDPRRSVPEPSAGPGSPRPPTCAILRSAGGPGAGAAAGLAVTSGPWKVSAGIFGGGGGQGADDGG